VSKIINPAAFAPPGSFYGRIAEHEAAAALLWSALWFKLSRQRG